MFDYLDKYRIVLVTGPQRSGTTIATKMIAHDTKHTALLEEGFGITDVNRWRATIHRRANLVIQCPTMCRHVHFEMAEDVAVVMMRRNVHDIIASEQRIKWPEHERLAELRRYHLGAGVPSIVKYAYWDEHQKDAIINAYEVDYRTLAGHPLWVDQADRATFSPRQTAVAQ